MQVDERTLKKLMAPRTRNNWGIFIVFILLFYGIVWLACKLGCLLYKIIIWSYNTFKEKKAKRGVFINRDNFLTEKLSTFGKLENCIMKNNNVVYYTVKKVVNGKNGLLQYVDFSVPDGDLLWTCNRTLAEYLMREMCTIKVAQRGECKGTIIMKDIEELTITQTLSKLYGSSVYLMRLENG